MSSTDTPNYADWSLAQLTDVLTEPDRLSKSSLLLIQQEMIKRNEPDIALQISEMLMNHPKTLSELTKAELSEHIQMRLANGESVDSIKMNLSENGVDVWDELNESANTVADQEQYMETLKVQGTDEDVLVEKMKARFGIDETEVKGVESRLRKRGTKKMIIGGFMLGCFIMLFLSSMNGVIDIGLRAYLLGGAGFWLLISGSNDRKL